MAAADAFFDSNVILYLMSADARKADRAESLLATGGVVSVQVLNEVADVARRKFGLDWSEVRDVLDGLRSVCRVDPVSIEVHEHALALAERFGLRIYDGLIVAAAARAGCTTLFTEDMHHGQTIDGLTLRNPFAGD